MVWDCSYLLLALPRTVLREMVATYLPEMGVPSDATSVIAGHKSQSERGVVVDSNAPVYQEQLAMHLEPHVKIGMTMSECNQSEQGTLKLTNWTDPVPPRLLQIVQRTLPSRIKVCELDCRLIAQALIDDIANGTDKENNCEFEVLMSNGKVVPSPGKIYSASNPTVPMMKQQQQLMPVPQQQMMMNQQQPMMMIMMMMMM